MMMSLRKRLPVTDGLILTPMIQMDPPLRTAYEQLEQDIKEALKAHPGNQSVMSAGMNTLLLYGDRPLDWGLSMAMRTTQKQDSASGS